MLGYPTNLLFYHLCFSNSIQQRGFTMIHMAHYGNHRRPRAQLVKCIFFDLQDLVFLKANLFYLIIKIAGYECSRIKVYSLIQGSHHPPRHEFLNNLTSLNAHLFSQLTNRYSIYQFDPAFNCLWYSYFSFLNLFNRYLYRLLWLI